MRDSVASCAVQNFRKNTRTQGYYGGDSRRSHTISLRFRLRSSLMRGPSRIPLLGFSLHSYPPYLQQCPFSSSLAYNMHFIYNFLFASLNRTGCHGGHSFGGLHPLQKPHTLEQCLVDAQWSTKPPVTLLRDKELVFPEHLWSSGHTPQQFSPIS